MSVILFLLCLVATSFSIEDTEWILLKRADTSETVHVTIALKQVNTEWLDNTLLEVSDPYSPTYGQYYSLEEIVSHVHANPIGVQRVRELFEPFGIMPRFTMGEGFATVNLPVFAAEEIFSTEFYHYRHCTNSNLTAVRALSYSIPKAIAEYVEFTCCIDQFPRSQSNGVTRSYNASRVSISPSSIREELNINDYKATNSSTTQAIAGFLKQFFSPKDLEKFQKKFDIPLNPIAKIIGKNDVIRAGVEASLDVQYITAVGQKVSTWFISITTFANKNQEDFLSWLMILVNTTDTPLVHSVSYGDYEDTISMSYMLRCEEEFKKLGIMGKTMLFATGDNGVNCHGLKSKFRPNWPASSPSITAVGGTSTVESVWEDGGGGFSNVFPTPQWQAETVKNWMENGDPPASKYFNASGRAYPDISTFAVDFEVIFDGGGMPVDGTSCAAPTAAGLVSLLNDVRLNNGQSSLGFMNPLLYKKLGESGFLDVTKGKNGVGFSCPGFKAVKGWDPASGWGNPNFKLLKDLVVE